MRHTLGNGSCVVILEDVGANVTGDDLRSSISAKISAQRLSRNSGG